MATIAAPHGQQPGLDGADRAMEFLRDIGKHFRVNKMIAKDAVAPG